MVVDPNINWDEVQPRPVRRTNVTTRAIGLAALPAEDDAVRACADGPTADPANEQPRPGPSGIAPVPRTNAAHRRRQGPLIQDGYIPPVPAPLQATKRQAQPGDTQPPVEQKRSRVFYSRAAKRQHSPAPPPSDQKRAREEAIALVEHLT